MRTIPLLALSLLAVPLVLAAEPGGFETWIRQSDALTTRLFVDGVEVCAETVGPAELVSWEGSTVNVQLEVPSGCGPAATVFGGDWRWSWDGENERSWWELRAFANGLPPTRGTFETFWGEPGTLHAEQDVAPGVVVTWDGWFHVVF